MKPILKVSAAVTLAALSAFPAVAATAPAKPAAPAKTAPVMAAVAKPAPLKVAVAKPAAPVKAAPKVLTFKIIDTNHDKKVSFAELGAVVPKLTKAEFAVADTDKSGSLSLKEVATFFKAHAKKK
jgi:hypothetical protein